MTTWDKDAEHGEDFWKQGDWGDLHDGQLIAAVWPSGARIGNLYDAGTGTLYLRLSEQGNVSSVDGLRKDGAALFVEATSSLPTEPGWYLAYDYVAEKTFPVECRDGALWFGYPNRMRLGDPERFTPFTRLEPVPVTVKRFAEKVKFELRAPGAWRTDKVVDVVAAQFGVTA